MNACRCIGKGGIMDQDLTGVLRLEAAGGERDRINRKLPRRVVFFFLRG